MFYTSLSILSHISSHAFITFSFRHSRYSEVDSVDVDQQIQNDLDDELDGHERVSAEHSFRTLNLNTKHRK